MGANGTACLCDFGLSVIQDGTSNGFTTSEFAGSWRYLAPELLEDETRTFSTDIFAYGCTCVEVRSVRCRSTKFTRLTYTIQLDSI